MSDLVLNNGVTEAAFLARFPLPYCTRALTPWEAQRLGLDPTEQQWIFTAPFTYISDRFGPITTPVQDTSDGASVPDRLQSVVGRTDEKILFASAPHDHLYENLGLTDQPLDAKTLELLAAQGLLAPGQVTRRLTKEQCDELICEAMFYLGADKELRSEVMFAISVGGKTIWNNRCDQRGLPQFKA